MSSKTFILGDVYLYINRHAAEIKKIKHEGSIYQYKHKTFVLLYNVFRNQLNQVETWPVFKNEQGTKSAASTKRTLLTL